ncbi:MAG: hypothetical protein DRQ59_06035 [Gammaproteobacteria bacterium]|nr:MAG: hypothetical protein DRQ59_06035 [Gammaproteobacteria bacterium]
MKFLNLAVASIVDANTGNGINRQYLDQFGSDQSAHERHGREIRSRSFLDLVAKIMASVQKYIEDSKAEAGRRQAIKDLSQMNDRSLKDIGLSRDDLYDIKHGSTSLEALNARRNRSADSLRLNHTSSKISSSVRGIESANQAQYETKKCA